MRLTASMVRELALNPTGLAQSIVAGGIGGAFGNPQRSWLEGAWRDYYNGHRDPDVFRNSLARRIRNSQARLKDRFSAGAQAIGDQFLNWDQAETSSPATVFPRGQDVRWRTHVLAIGLHLVYIAAGGYTLRYLWTDHGSSVLHQDIALFAAAAVIYGDTVLGAENTRGVQVWQLRRVQRRDWTRTEAEANLPALARRIAWLEQSTGGGLSPAP